MEGKCRVFRYQELPLLFHQVSFLVAALFIQTYLTVDVEDEKTMQ